MTTTFDILSTSQVTLYRGVISVDDCWLITIQARYWFDWSGTKEWSWEYTTSIEPSHGEGDVSSDVAIERAQMMASAWAMVPVVIRQMRDQEPEWTKTYERHMQMKASRQKLKESEARAEKQATQGMLRIRYDQGNDSAGSMYRGWYVEAIDGLGMPIDDDSIYALIGTCSKQAHAVAMAINLANDDSRFNWISVYTKADEVKDTFSVAGSRAQRWIEMAA
jgi:hypothetical protein